MKPRTGRCTSCCRAGEYDGKTGYSKTFANFACDVNRDGWIDSVITTMMGEPSLWYENPQNKPGSWKVHTGTRSACNETPVFADLLGNGKPVAHLGCAARRVHRLVQSAGRPVQAVGHAHRGRTEGPGQRANSVTAWAWATSTATAATMSLSCRAGGRPRRTARRSTGRSTRWISGRTVRDMVVYDIDGDGDNDVITSSAHAYGIWWFEQLPGGKFEKHEICKTFSQTHAIRLADINRDGIMDFVTGKRYFAHNGKDPGAFEPALLVWFEIQRPEKGKVQFVQHTIDEDSGLGTQFEVVDINGDGKLDIVTANKKGVHLFLQVRSVPARASEKRLTASLQRAL